MIKPNQLVVALAYVLCVVLLELGSYYLVVSIQEVTDYVMLLMTGLLLGISWLIKPKIAALFLAVVLIVLYGVLSFYSDFPIYFVGYPNTLEEFLPDVGLKTLFYAFPLIAYVAIKYKA